MSKKSEIIWKSLYAILFGGLGWEIMSFIVNYNRNMTTIENGLNCLGQDVYAVEEKLGMIVEEDQK